MLGIKHKKQINENIYISYWRSGSTGPEEGVEAMLPQGEKDRRGELIGQLFDAVVVGI